MPSFSTNTCILYFTKFYSISQGIYFLCLLLFLKIPACEGELRINYPNCSACSKQANIPCVVKDFRYHCIPPGNEIFSNKWPGPPRNLKAKTIRVPNSTMWRAVFTWQPPYDASIDYLKGFYITANYQEETGMGVPYCFYMNLTRPDWGKQPGAINVKYVIECILEKIPQIRNVTIHQRHKNIDFLHHTRKKLPPKSEEMEEYPFGYFLATLNGNGRNSYRDQITDTEFVFDCLQSQRPVRVTLDVKSMPRPHNNTHFKYTSVHLPGNITDYNWKPIFETKVEQDREVARVSVWFSPCYPGAKSHVICLNKVKEKSCVNSTIIEAPQNKVIFHKVPCKYNYTIWLRPLNENRNFMISHYLQSKRRVECQASPVELSVVEAGDSESVSRLSAFIIVPVILLVVVTSTVVIFCRRRGRFQQWCFAGNVEQTEVLSKIEDRNNGRIILPIYCKNNKLFEKCVASFIQYLENVGGVRVLKDDIPEEKLVMKIKQWLTGEGIYDIMFILSDDLIQMFQDRKQSLDLCQSYSIDNNNSYHLANQMYDFLEDIDNGFSDGQKPPIVVSFFATTSVKCLSIFGNVGQIFTVAETQQQSYTCTIKQDDMRQLILLAVNSFFGHNGNLSPASLTGSANAKSLIQHLQNLLKQSQLRPRVDIQRLLEHKESQDLAVHMQPLRKKDLGRSCVEYTRPVPNNIQYEPDCREPQHPSICLEYPSQIKDNDYPYVKSEHAVIANGHAGVNKGPNAYYVRLPNKIDKSRINGDVKEDIARQSLSEFQDLSASESCYISEDMVSSGYYTTEPEQAPFLSADFIPPDSDDDTDNVSLPQRIADMNKRQILKWQNKT